MLPPGEGGMGAGRLPCVVLHLRATGCSPARKVEHWEPSSGADLQAQDRDKQFKMEWLMEMAYRDGKLQPVALRGYCIF